MVRLAYGFHDADDEAPMAVLLLLITVAFLLT